MRARRLSGAGAAGVVGMPKGGSTANRPSNHRESGEMAGKQTFPRTQRIGIFVFEGFEPIDVWGFAEAFAIARFLGTPYASPPAYPFEVILISRDGGGVKSINGPSVAPDW